MIVSIADDNKSMTRLLMNNFTMIVFLNCLAALEEYHNATSNPLHLTNHESCLKLCLVWMIGRHYDWLSLG